MMRNTNTWAFPPPAVLATEHVNVTQSRFLSARLEGTEILFLITWSFVSLRINLFLFNTFLLGGEKCALCEEIEFFLNISN